MKPLYKTKSRIVRVPLVPLLSLLNAGSGCDLNTPQSEKVISTTGWIKGAM